MRLTPRLLAAAGLLATLAVQAQTKWDLPAAYQATNFHSVNLQQFADDVDKAWDEIGQYLLHDVRMYADWNPGNDYSAGFSDVKTVEELRANPTSHRIYSVDEAVSRVRAGEVLNLSPLCGGVPPEIAWPYLKRVGETVMAEAAK